MFESAKGGRVQNRLKNASEWLYGVPFSATTTLADLQLFLSLRRLPAEALAKEGASKEKIPGVQATS